MSSNSHRAEKVFRRGEDGYILLALLLIVALMIIFAAITLPTVAFDIKRDREEELIHRGVQYSRAIRAYYKKFGRYPTKLEDLESTNNLRFLRKRYKDPLNCKAGKCQDFKLLHYSEVQLSGSLGIGGGTIPGANSVGQMNGTNGPGGAGGFGQTSTLGGNTLGGNSFGGNGAAGTNSNSATGPGQQTGGNQTTGSDATDSSTPGTGTPGNTGSNAGSSSGSNSGNNSGNPVIGGGPIVGVTSGNKKDKSIREFNHKVKYSDWLFIYDPGTDRGGMIMTPYQPQLMGFGQQGQMGGTTPGAPGSGISPIGSSPVGTQNNSNSPGYSQPNPPTSPTTTPNGPGSTQQ